MVDDKKLGILIQSLISLQSLIKQTEL